MPGTKKLESASPDATVKPRARSATSDPKRLRLGAEPRTFLRDPAQWPTGRPKANAPRPLLYGLVIARKVAAWVAAEGMSVAGFAERAGMSRQAAYDLLGGKQLPDFYTIVRLEETLGQRLWPTEQELTAVR